MPIVNSPGGSETAKPAEHTPALFGRSRHKPGSSTGKESGGGTKGGGGEDGGGGGGGRGEAFHREVEIHHHHHGDIYNVYAPNNNGSMPIGRGNNAYTAHQGTGTPTSVQRRALATPVTFKANAETGKASMTVGGTPTSGGGGKKKKKKKEGGQGPTSPPTSGSDAPEEAPPSTSDTPDEPKPDQPKPDEPKPDQPKPDEPKPDEPKPDQPKPDELKPGFQKVLTREDRRRLAEEKKAQAERQKAGSAGSAGSSGSAGDGSGEPARMSKGDIRKAAKAVHGEHGERIAGWGERYRTSKRGVTKLVADAHPDAHADDQAAIRDKVLGLHAAGVKRQERKDKVEAVVKPLADAAKAKAGEVAGAAEGKATQRWDVRMQERDDAEVSYRRSQLAKAVAEDVNQYKYSEEELPHKIAEMSSSAHEAADLPGGHVGAQNVANEVAKIVGKRPDFQKIGARRMLRNDLVARANKSVSVDAKGRVSTPESREKLFNPGGDRFKLVEGSVGEYEPVKPSWSLDKLARKANDTMESAVNDFRDKNRAEDEQKAVDLAARSAENRERVGQAVRDVVQGVRNKFNDRAKGIADQASAVVNEGSEPKPEPKQSVVADVADKVAEGAKGARKQGVPAGPPLRAVEKVARAVGSAARKSASDKENK